jgi:hypothetical protein
MELATKELFQRFSTFVTFGTTPNNVWLWEENGVYGDNVETISKFIKCVSIDFLSEGQITQVRTVITGQVLTETNISTSYIKTEPTTKKHTATHSTK